jgi:GntR family transcriptional repressor for pyruvate dehydrogenase complex
MAQGVEQTTRGTRPAFEIVPIERVDVHDLVLTRLTALVTESGLKPGDRLPPERELVERLRVSRTTVREALRVLESMGKIEIRRNAGSFVVEPSANAISTQLKAAHPISVEFLGYLVDVRAAVEDRVVTVMARMPERDLTEARATLARARDEFASGGYERGSLDLRFEAALCRATGNPLLLELQRSIHELWVEAWSEFRIAPGDRWELHEDHCAILAAIESGDVVEARELMSNHVDRTLGLWNETGKGETT